jgi:Rrf2 family protein
LTGEVDEDAVIKLLMKVDYGVRALVDLAQHQGPGPVQTNEIARRQGVPEPYLDQLLTALRKAGFISTTRGRQGGHALARSAAEITLAAVVEALDGPIADFRCERELDACRRARYCAQRAVWQQLRSASEAVLEGTTIADVARREAAAQAQHMYYI